MAGTVVAMLHNEGKAERTAETSALMSLLHESKQK